MWICGERFIYQQKYISTKIYQQKRIVKNYKVEE
jgi:hypothetical protein